MSAGQESTTPKISTYYAGMHMVLCTGPIDYIGFIQVKETQINSIPILGGGLPTDVVGKGTPTYFVDLPELFGGLKREGGIRGILSFAFGYPEQNPDPYLFTKTLSFNSYRGVVSVILNKMYLGTSYYLHQWRFFCTRVTVREKGLPQWQPDLASPLLPLDTTFSYTYSGLETEPQNFGLSTALVHTGYYVIKGTSVWIVLDDTKLALAEGYRVVQNSFAQTAGGLINAVHVIRECLTDTEWGLGEPEAAIDENSFALAAVTCFNEGLGFSWLWDKVKPIHEFISEVAKHINAVVFRDRVTNLWRITLIRKVQALGTLTVVTTDHVQKINKLSRKGFHDLTSQYVLTYESNLTYKEATVRVADASLAARQGKEVVTSATFSGVATPEVAQIIAMRELKALSVPVYVGSLTGDRTLARLNPGDAFILKAMGGLEGDLVLRVVSLELGTAMKEPVTLEFTEDAFEATSGVRVFQEGSKWTPPSAEALPVTIRKVFESPYYAQALEKGDAAAQAIPTSSTFVRATAVSPSGLAITSELWDTTATTFSLAGLIDFQFAGLLTEAIDKLTTTLAIGSIEDESNLSTGLILYLEEELLAVTGYDLAAGTLEVSRGVLDTVPEPHASGTWVIGVRTLNSKDPTEYLVGETLRAKLLTKTPSETLALADAPEDSLELIGRMHRPYPPGNLQINGESWLAESPLSGVLVFTWTSRNRFQQTTSEILDYYAASVTSEPDVTYNLTLRLDSTNALIYSFSGAVLTKTVTALDIPPEVTLPALVRVELNSENANGVSFQTVKHVFNFTSPGLMAFTAEDDITEFTDTDGITLLGV